MSRSRQRSPSVLYRLYEAGNPEPVQEGRPPVRNQAPEWVTQVLGVQRVDDLDIQVGNQKTPVFLLNETASRRAQILSIGREASHLKTMMKRYEELKDGDREVMKFGEAAIARLDFRLARMTGLDDAYTELSELVVDGDEMLTTLERREELGRLMARYERLRADEMTIAQEQLALAELPRQAPVLKDTSVLARLAQTLEATGKRALLPAPEALPKTPALKDLAAVARLALTIEQAQLRLRGDALPDMPKVPVLRDNSTLLEYGKRLNGLASREKSLQTVPDKMPKLPELFDASRIQAMRERLMQASAGLDASNNDLKFINAEFDRALSEHEQTKQECGGLCPLCGSGFPAGYTETQDRPHVH
jgi:hypothetical protein